MSFAIVAINGSLRLAASPRIHSTIDGTFAAHQSQPISSMRRECALQEQFELLVIRNGQPANNFFSSDPGPAASAGTGGVVCRPVVQSRHTAMPFSKNFSWHDINFVSQGCDIAVLVAEQPAEFILFVVMVTVELVPAPTPVTVTKPVPLIATVPDAVAVPAHV